MPESLPESDPAARSIGQPPEHLTPILRLPPTDERAHADDDEEEPLGGDPACWAHLFEDEDETPT